MPLRHWFYPAVVKALPAEYFYRHNTAQVLKFKQILIEFNFKNTLEELANDKTKFYAYRQADKSIIKFSLPIMASSLYSITIHWSTIYLSGDM